MTFEKYLETLDIDANLGMSVFGLEDLRAAWEAATDVTYNAGWQDAMSRLPKGSLVPEGYVLVPVEPTEAIKRALYKNKGFSEESIYEEILRAAQEEE